MRLIRLISEVRLFWLLVRFGLQTSRFNARDLKSFAISSTANIDNEFQSAKANKPADQICRANSIAQLWPLISQLSLCL
jgi:hypothetical protein